MKFRKKPVVIEATQFTYIDGINGLLTCELAHKLGLSRNYPSLLWEIKTLEGWHIVSENDWVITGVKGEKYPCKPDIFEMTYELNNAEIEGDTNEETQTQIYS